MDKEITEWLLAGPTWLKFAVQNQLLGIDADAAAASGDGAVAKLTARIKDGRSGLPALKTGAVSCESAGSAVWDIFFLADIGLTAADLNLEQEIEYALGQQLGSGEIITEPGMAANYYCMSAILISAIARMGYREDRRVSRYVEAVMRSQHGDGGWVCEGYYTESCPMDNLNVLQLLGQYPEHRRDPRFRGAVDLLLEHWRRRPEKWRLHGFGIGRRFLSLEYPAIKYGILRVLDVLSLFPYATAQPGFRDMLDFVRGKGREGKYYAEPTTGAYGDFDFGQTALPSRWLTFLVNRIEKRGTDG